MACSGCQRRNIGTTFNQNCRSFDGKRQSPLSAGTWTQGDNVVVINAEKIVVNRQKGYPKSPIKAIRDIRVDLRSEAMRKCLKEHPERIIEHAVAGMIPDNRLKSDRMLRLKVVIGDE